MLTEIPGLLVSPSRSLSAIPVADSLTLTLFKNLLSWSEGHSAASEEQCHPSSDMEEEELVAMPPRNMGLEYGLLMPG